MRVLLVDDHAVVRQGYRRLLGEAYRGAQVSEAASAAEALALVAADRWDLVIVDLNMPGRNGLETLKDIHALDPQLPVLVATMHNEAAYAVRAFKAGARGFITKDSPPEDLYDAIQCIRGGNRYVPERFTDALVAALSTGSAKGPHSLSDREFQVLGLLGKGRSVGQIADELGLSEKTVSTYRSRLLEKLSLSNTAELMRFAIQHDIGG